MKCVTSFNRKVIIKCHNIIDRYITYIKCANKLHFTVKCKSFIFIHIQHMVIIIIISRDIELCVTECIQ